MKAVILAGGEGSRLFPVSAGRCKALTDLLGLPVLDYAVSRLREAGITDLILAAGPFCDDAARAFGDGRARGVGLTYVGEDVPQGTGGALRACGSLLAGGDFLLVCGDVVWDFDLRPAIARHLARRDAVTLVLTSHRQPGQYGVASCDGEGNVLRFEEKPALFEGSGAVFTGIAVCSPALLRFIPRAPCDFSSDVLPRLLAQGVPVGSACAAGFWADVGTPERLLDCSCQLLSGLGPRDWQRAPVRPGVWSSSPLPENAQFIPPCFLGENVSVGEGCLIGPHAVLGDGVSVGGRSLVQRSLLLGSAGPRSTLYGAVVAPGAALGSGCVLNDGSVAGAGARLENDVILMEKVKVFPGLSVPAGQRLTEDLRELLPPRVSRRSPPSPEELLRLGRMLGRGGTVALGCGGGERAHLLARAAGCGAAASGGRVLFHDGRTPAQAAWVRGRYGASASLYLSERESSVHLYLYDEPSAVCPPDEGAAGEWSDLTGVPEAYVRDLAGALSAPAGAPGLFVPCDTPEHRALAAGLEAAGFPLHSRPEGVPQLGCDPSGFSLFCRDETGVPLPPETVDALTARSGEDDALRCALRLAFLLAERGLPLSALAERPAEKPGSVACRTPVKNGLYFL